MLRLMTCANRSSDPSSTITKSSSNSSNLFIENTQSGQQQVCVLNSMQSVSRKEVKEGVHYLNIMEENLNMIRKLLG